MPAEKIFFIYILDWGFPKIIPKTINMTQLYILCFLQHVLRERTKYSLHHSKVFQILMCLKQGFTLQKIINQRAVSDINWTNRKFNRRKKDDIKVKEGIVPSIAQPKCSQHSIYHKDNSIQVLNYQKLRHIMIKESKQDISTNFTV